MKNTPMRSTKFAGIEITDSKFQISSSRFQISSSKFQISDFKFHSDWVLLIFAVYDWFF